MYHPHLLQGCSELVCSKAGAVVREHDSGATMHRKDMIQETAHNGGGSLIWNRDRHHPLGEVILDNKDVFIALISHCRWTRSQNIHTDHVER